MKLTLINILEQTKETKFTLPKGHKPGMEVPKGGSCCGNCKFISQDKKHCSSKYFQDWNGGDEIPAPADEYCSDWYEPK